MKHIIENKHRLDTGSQKLISAESLIIHQLTMRSRRKLCSLHHCRRKILREIPR